MWSDNETAEDLLGFKVHADLIRQVVTDEKVLPVVMGVFGDWGGGKSSIMRMLEKSLADDEKDGVLCLYFNGWIFEGYEDAKTALLTSILIQLGEHKRLGPKLKDGVVRLLKHVKLMDTAKLGIKYVGVPLAAAWLTGGVAAVPAAAAALASLPRKAAEKADDDKQPPGADTWLDLIEADPTKPDLIQVQKFREEFADLLKKTSLKSLVILIDDLDRCLPDRIIDTLEAIKLFVAVPHTAFVIGADPRIIRHAISTRYVSRSPSTQETGAGHEPYDLVQDYLEKLIQIPYYLPRLSPAEIETYMNLLTCGKHLDQPQWGLVRDHWVKQRKGNFYAAFTEAEVRKALGGKLPGPIETRLAWSNSVAGVLTEGLKGNPRQVKRMLNAMLLREALATIAEIQVKSDVLAKLMTLEYGHPEQFRELSNWQAAESGIPANLQKLEAWALSAEEEPPSELANLKTWTKPSVRSWIRLQPSLGGVDLRDYFWLARDRTSSTLTGVTMVSPATRLLFSQLIGGNDAEVSLAAKEATGLTPMEQSDLLGLLERQVERQPDLLPSINAFWMLIDQKVPGAAEAFFRGLSGANPKLVAAGAVFRLESLAKEPALKSGADRVLALLAESTGPAAIAAKKVLTRS